MWIVAQVEPGCEHLARLFLMRDHETYAPRIRVRKKIALLFPSYLFVRIELRWYDVRWSPRVVRVLMNGESPAELPERVVLDLHKREHGGFVRLPPPPGKALKAGEKVRILSGSFMGHIAVYQGQSAHERICVLLDLLGRSVPTELAKGDQIGALPVASP
jgi:transcription antitermination factor NusG